jgi:hypothetical protein
MVATGGAVVISSVIISAVVVVVVGDGVVGGGGVGGVVVGGGVVGASVVGCGVVGCVEVGKSVAGFVGGGGGGDEVPAVGISSGTQSPASSQLTSSPSAWTPACWRNPPGLTSLPATDFDYCTCFKEQK